MAALQQQYDVVEALLYKHWPKFPQASNKAHSARMGMSDSEKMVLLPKYAHLKGLERPRFCTLGVVHNRFHGRKMPSKSTEAFPELYAEVLKLGELLKRKFKATDTYHDIHINASTVASPHVDGRQTGESIIVALGDYTGGETVLYRDKDDTRGVKHNIRRKPLKFDANITWHGSTPFKARTGKTRFSLVFHPTKDHVIRAQADLMAPPLPASAPVCYNVAVMSASAAATVKKALPWLKKAQRGHMANVTVFVPSAAEVAVHRGAVHGADCKVKVMATRGGSHFAQRTWVQRHYYRPGSNLVIMDGSVVGLVANDGSEHTAPLPALAKKMFAECKAKGTVLWGLKRTLRPPKGAGFEVVPIQLFGCIAGDAGIVGARPARVGGDTADELETSLRVHRRYAATVVLHSVGVKGGRKQPVPDAAALRALGKVYSEAITVDKGKFAIN